MRASRCEDAEEQLARTVRQTRTVFANRDQLTAVVGQRRADLSRAQADFDRRKNLAASGAVSGEELGHARDELKAAQDALTAAQKSLAASTALVGHTGRRRQPRRAGGGHPGGARLAQPQAHQRARAGLRLRRQARRAAR